MEDVISSLVVTSTYPQDVATAVAAAAALIAILAIAWLVVSATYLIVRLFTELARASAATAALITIAIITTMIIIGWLNR